jgi:hypothetical protein
MPHESAPGMPTLQLRQSEKPPTTLPLAAGRYRIGSGSEAAVRIEGLPPIAIELAVGESGLTTIQSTIPMNVGGQPFVAGVPRHLRVGEEVVFGPVVAFIHKDGRAKQGTTAFAKDILGSLVEGDLSTALPGIVWLTGADLGKRVDLVDETALVGRAHECEIRLRDRLVSRRHARIVMAEDSARLVDLDSANGVWVNGKRVRQELLLTGGELIQIGTTLLAFEAGTATEPHPAAPRPSQKREPAPEGEAKKDNSEDSEPPTGEAEASPEMDPDMVLSRSRGRSDWLLAAAGVLALGIAAAVVVIVLV